MAFSQGSRSGLAYIVESTFGVTPTSPAMISIPYTSHTLDLTKERLQGNDLQSDRMPRVDRHGNRNALGDIVVDLRPGDYDDFLESAMFEAFASTLDGVLKVGTTPQFLSIEDSADDITQFRQFSGMAVSQMAINIAPNQMAQCTFSMVGKDMVQAQAALDATPTAASGNQPFDSYSGSISDGGGEIAIVTGLSFSMQNSLAPTFVVGSASTPQLEFGRAVVEGQVSVYYENAALIDKFLNETETVIQVVLDDPATGSTLTFDFPRAKYNGASVPVSSPQSRIATLPFVSLFDESEATNLKITRT